MVNEETKHYDEYERQAIEEHLQKRGKSGSSKSKKDAKEKKS
jgi:hypothetical protein